MNIITQYINLSKSILKILNINIYDHDVQFSETYERMLLKYEPKINNMDLMNFSFVFEELLDSVVDIIYYICDYVSTLEYNTACYSSESFIIEDVFILDRLKYQTISEYISLVDNFSHKACEDYYFFHHEIRTLNITHINNMISSEIFEFMSVLMIFFSGLDYKNDFDMFQHMIDIIESGDVYEVDCVYDAINSFFDTIVYKDIISGKNLTIKFMLDLLFITVHGKNMLKIFPEDNKFHFGTGLNQKKVQKPKHWEHEIDNNPKYNPKEGEDFLHYIGILCNSIKVDHIISLVNN